MDTNKTGILRFVTVFACGLVAGNLTDWNLPLLLAVFSLAVIVEAILFMEDFFAGLSEETAQWITRSTREDSRRSRKIRRSTSRGSSAPPTMGTAMRCDTATLYSNTQTKNETDPYQTRSIPTSETSKWDGSRMRGKSPPPRSPETPR